MDCFKAKITVSYFIIVAADGPLAGLPAAGGGILPSLIFNVSEIGLNSCMPMAVINKILFRMQDVLFH